MLPAVLTVSDNLLQIKLVTRSFVKLTRMQSFVRPPVEGSSRTSLSGALALCKFASSDRSLIVFLLLITHKRDIVRRAKERLFIRYEYLQRFRIGCISF